MVMHLVFLKSCFSMEVRSSSALEIYRSMMPSYFIFAIYFVNFSWRRCADLSLNLLWWLFLLLVSDVVFDSVCFVLSSGGRPDSAKNYANVA